MLINHSQLSKTKMSPLSQGQFSSWITFLLLFFLGLFPRIFSAETGRNSRCWGAGSPGEHTGVELVSDQKWCHQVAGSKMKKRELLKSLCLGSGVEIWFCGQEGELRGMVWVYIILPASASRLTKLWLYIWSNSATLKKICKKGNNSYSCDG